MDGLCWTSHQHWWEEVDNLLVDLHLSETNGPCRAWTWTAHVTDREANHYAISLPLPSMEIYPPCHMFSIFVAYHAWFQSYDLDKDQGKQKTKQKKTCDHAQLVPWVIMLKYIKKYIIYSIRDIMDMAQKCTSSRPLRQGQRSNEA